jgi:hypothetical protein
MPHWAWLIGLFAGIMLLAVLADWWLSGLPPNPWFYLLVPPISIVADGLGSWGASRLFRDKVTFWRVLGIVLGVNALLQGLEIVEKVTYYFLWHYPGLLYLGANLVFTLALGTYAFRRWGGQRWRASVTMAVAGLMVSLLVGALFAALTGLSTPGSQLVPEPPLQVIVAVRGRAGKQPIVAEETTCLIRHGCRAGPRASRGSRSADSMRTTPTAFSMKS